MLVAHRSRSLSLRMALPMKGRVNCPACSCDVTDRVRDAAAMRLPARINKAQFERVAKMLTEAEAWFDEDRARQSWRGLWRPDVRAIRYMFNRASLASDASG